MTERVDPTAPIVQCIVCGKDVHTCERETPVNGDYTCPAHPDGIEYLKGWVCSDKCGEKYVDRIMDKVWDFVL